MVQISLKKKELSMIEASLDSVDFYLSDDVSQKDEDKFFEELLSLKQKIHVVIEKQDEIDHVKDLMGINRLNFLTNEISLDKYLEEKDLLNERIKQIKNKKRINKK